MITYFFKLYTGLEEAVCSICFSVITDYYKIETKFKCLLSLVCPKMRLQTSDGSVTCCECLQQLVELEHCKTRWLEIEERIHQKFTTMGTKINILEMVNPQISNENEIINICRLCLMDCGFLSSLTTRINDVSLEEMVLYGLPDLQMNLSYDPMICDLCTRKLKVFYMFTKKCMATEYKMKTFTETTGVTIDGTNNTALLSAVTEYFKETKDADEATIFVKYYCDVCDFETFKKIALKHHKTIKHSMPCIYDPIQCCEPVLDSTE